MLSRPSRWLPALFVALATTFATPTRAQAATQILVAEVQVDAAGNVVLDGSGQAVRVGAVQVYAGTGLATAHFANVNVNSSRSNLGTSDFHTLTTTVTANPNGAGGNLAGNYGLQVIYRDDTFLNSNPGGIGAVTNNAGASAAIGGVGTNTATVSTQLFNGTVPLPDGPLLSPYGPATGTATETINEQQVKTTGPVVGFTNVGNLPAQYGTQQMIYIIVQSAAGISNNSSLGGTLSSFVITTPAAPVPAPAALVLALTALPILGWRRAFGRKPAA